MKKLLCLILSILLVLTLSSCQFAKDLFDSSINAKPVSKTFTCEDLSIELTSDFLTMDFLKEDNRFVWGDGTVTVVGMFAEIDEETLQEMTAYDYANAFYGTLDNDDISPITEINGVPTLSYTETDTDGSTTLLLTFHKSTDGIWIVFFGIDALEYQDHYDEICNYVSSIQVSDP